MTGGRCPIHDDMPTLLREGYLFATQRREQEGIDPASDRPLRLRLLGKPAKRMTFDLKQETDWDWNWIDPPNREMIFTATFGPDGRVKRSGSVEKLPEGR